MLSVSGESISRHKVLTRLSSCTSVTCLNRRDSRMNEIYDDNLADTTVDTPDVNNSWNDLFTRKRDTLSRVCAEWKVGGRIYWVRFHYQQNYSLLRYYECDKDKPQGCWTYPMLFYTAMLCHPMTKLYYCWGKKKRKYKLERVFYSFEETLVMICSGLTELGLHLILLMNFCIRTLYLWSVQQNSCNSLTNTVCFC